MRMGSNSLGVSLVEIIVALSLFAILTTALGLALRSSSSAWKSSSGQQEAGQRIRNVCSHLEQHVSMARLPQSRIEPVPPSLSGGGYDGDAFWYLSHINPHDGKAYLKSDGTPFWQCNVLYYPVVPEQVERSNAGQNGEGYEDRCPYKVLVRKVVDLSGPSDLTNEDTAERLLDDPTPYLTRTVGHDASHMLSEPELLSARVISTDLLFFRVESQTTPPGLQFDLRALSQAKAQSVATATTGSLLDSPDTLQSLLFIPARN